MRKLFFLSWLFLLFAAVSDANDPLADEIAKWKRFAETNQSTSEDWKAVRDGSLPLLEKAAKAITDGKRNAAVHYLAAVRGNLAGSKFVQEHRVTPDTKLAELEKEWSRAGSTLSPPPPNLTDVPAAFRAVAEASHSEIKTYYEASLEYGRNTTAEYGYFYLGLSEAQLEFVKLLGSLREQRLQKAPGFRGLTRAMDQLEDELLAAYKPPASIDHHPTFIRASAMIKQARELDEADSKFGAVYRLLQARQVLSKVTNPGITMTTEDVIRRSEEWNAKLQKQNVDHSIARIFMERAAVEPEDAETAAAIFQEVLPLYVVAMEPGRATKANQTPVATVTFVRWPYT